MSILLDFYQKHSKLLVLTFVLAIIGTLNILGSFLGFLFDIIFCPYPYSEGVFSISTEICKTLGRI